MTVSSPDNENTDTPAQADTATLEAVHLAAEGRRQCLLGFHAWVPWLTTYRGGNPADGVQSHMTWCVRPGCDACEGWDD